MINRSKTSHRDWQIGLGVVLSIFLMFLQYFNAYTGLNQIQHNMLASVYQFVDRPFIKWQQFLATKAELISLKEENAKQKAELMLLQARLTRVQNIESENAQLLTLLRSSTSVPGKVLAANILTLEFTGASSDFLIDKGSEDGAYPGQPILDGYGVVGQIISVNNTQSLAKDIRDQHSGVPVEIKRNHLRGVIAGDESNGALKLLYMTESKDVQIGDILITSGLGQQFPAGYPVGTVKRVSGRGSRQHLDIEISPLAHLDQSRQILLAWPNRSSSQLNRAGK